MINLLLKLETLNYLLANRRIPGEIRRVLKTTHVSPLNRQMSLPTEINPSSSDTTIEEMQHKLNEIHHELQVLTDIYQNLDSKSLDFNKQKQMLNVKRESLKREFRGVIMKLQIKKNSFHKTIPSDDVFIIIYIFLVFTSYQIFSKFLTYNFFDT